jgi:succinate-acetate transporter protein
MNLRRDLETVLRSCLGVIIGNIFGFAAFFAFALVAGEMSRPHVIPRPAGWLGIFLGCLMTALLASMTADRGKIITGLVSACLFVGRGCPG